MFAPQLAKGAKMRFHIGSEKGLVIMDFGTSLSHLEMEPQEAEKIAEYLLKHAINARAGKTLCTSSTE